MAEISTNSKLITCILPKGRSLPLQEALSQEHGIHSGNFHYARGVGRDSHIRDRGIGEQQEREVFEVVVESSIADDIFDFIFSSARMAEPHGGMIYMAALPKSTVMSLPELPDQNE